MINQIPYRWVEPVMPKLVLLHGLKELINIALPTGIEVTLTRGSTSTAA